MKCTFLCKPGLAVCALLIKCFSCTIFCLFNRIPKYEILKCGMKIILNGLYVGIIIFTCEVKLDHYDDKTLYYVLYHNLPLVAYHGCCWNLPQCGSLKVHTVMLYAVHLMLPWLNHVVVIAYIYSVCHIYSYLTEFLLCLFLTVNLCNRFCNNPQYQIWQKSDHFKCTDGKIDRHDKQKVTLHNLYAAVYLFQTQRTY
jgi:hypothetical protein